MFKSWKRAKEYCGSCCIKDDPPRAPSKLTPTQNVDPAAMMTLDSNIKAMGQQMKPMGIQSSMQSSLRPQRTHKKTG